MLRFVPQRKMPKGMGRHIDHDPRNREFDFSQSRTPKAAKHHDVSWDIEGTVLDQKKLGACTGFAAAALVNSTLFRPARRNVGLIAANATRTLANKNAIELYKRATRFDPFPGYYEPTDQGSTGNAVAKALREAGYVDEYRWCFSFDSFLSALMTQPVLVGTYWTEQMFTPKAGVVRVGQLVNGNIVGGHEYLCIGVHFASEMLEFRQSWGYTWGMGGTFLMSIPDFKMLLKADGDVTVPHGVGLP